MIKAKEYTIEWLVEFVPSRIGLWSNVFTTSETVSQLLDAFVMTAPQNLLERELVAKLIHLLPGDLRMALRDRLALLPDEDGKWHCRIGLIVEWAHTTPDEEIKKWHAEEFNEPPAKEREGIARLSSMLGP